MSIFLKIRRTVADFRDSVPEAKWDARIVVCQEKIARITDDGILILPGMEFFTRLWSGEWS